MSEERVPGPAAQAHHLEAHPSEPQRRKADVFDVVGIGFGPANLALAVAMEEAGEPLDRLFLEARPGHAWHPGMLIDDSLLQITVLKDLITVENPRSRFTFLSYLKEQGRLYDFLNLRDLFPTRAEFSDYLGWVAAQLAAHVRYGRQVVAVHPAKGGDLLRVETRTATGERESLHTRHLVLAAGAEPRFPPGVEPSEDGRILHPHCFKQRIARFADRQAPYRFVVVGGGQSAGEIFEYLTDHYPNADITATVRGFGYKPVDESDFTNRIFFPEWVDYYYDLPAEKRKIFFDSLKDVNYAAIDHPLIRRIYTKLYRQKVAGRERCRLLPFLDLEGVDESESSITMTFRDVMREHPVEIEADALILCTGYEWRKEHPLLDHLAPWFERDGQGGYQVRRDYSIAARPGFRPRVYLQGYCEATHGISETVLSLLPVRAREILQSLLAAESEKRRVEKL